VEGKEGIGRVVHAARGDAFGRQPQPAERGARVGGQLVEPHAVRAQHARRRRSHGLAHQRRGRAHTGARERPLERARMDLTRRVDEALARERVQSALVAGVRAFDRVVYYEVEVATASLRWRVSARFERLYQMHLELSELQVLQHRRDRLPPFPEKRYKLATNHLAPLFVQERRALIDNYLRRVAASEAWGRAAPFLHLCSPGSHLLRAEEVLADEKAQPKGAPAADARGDLRAFAALTAVEIDRVTHYVIPSGAGLPESPWEVTWFRVAAAQVLRGDHVIYQLVMSAGEHLDGAETWVVLKRFEEFVELDRAVRAAVRERHEELLPHLPALPPKQFKLFVDHLNPVFIERRRVLLENYMQILLATPFVRTVEPLLRFLGI
jgi:hypothetical protein